MDRVKPLAARAAPADDAARVGEEVEALYLNGPAGGGGARKSNTSILSLIAYRAEDYPLLAGRVTVDAVATHLRGIVLGEIRRFELPHLWGLQFVCERSLGGGVTTSLALDAHGKTLSYELLEMVI
jgi:hypothetical protein